MPDGSSPASSPIFVVGPPRSGTHLVRFCLSQHSRLHIGPETRFFLSLEGNRRLLPPRSFPERAEEIVETFLRSGDPTMADLEPLRPELIEAVRAGPRDYRGLCDALLGTVARSNGKVRWGEKTPFHVLYIRRIRALFPQARVVLVRRESRNMAASYLRSPLLPDGLALAVAQLRLCVAAGEEAVRKGWAYPVEYERLVEEPESVLRGVAEYVGEAFEDGMLRPGMRDSSFGSGQLMQREEGMGIIRDPNEADKWRKALSPEQAEWVRSLVDGAPGRVPVRFRLRVASLETRQRLMHTRNRLGLHGIKMPDAQPG